MKKKRLSLKALSPHILLITLTVFLSAYPLWFLIISMVWLLLLIPLTTLMMGLILILDLMKKKICDISKYYLSMYILFVALFFIGSHFFVPFFKALYYQQYGQYDQTTADQTVTAIQKYRSGNGIYPQNLAELVPKYLQSVPQTRKGRSFTYSHTSGENQGFSLSYPNQLTGMCYSNVDNNPKWDACDFGL